MYKDQARWFFRQGEVRFPVPRVHHPLDERW
jgi:hypothetical protein